MSASNDSNGLTDLLYITLFFIMDFPDLASHEMSTVQN